MARNVGTTLRVRPHVTKNSNVDLVAVLAATALLLFAVASGKPSAIDRREGGTFLAAYACYIVFVIQRG